MNRHDLLAHIVRLEQRRLSPGTLAVLTMPDSVIETQLQRQLSWSPAGAAAVRAKLNEMRGLDYLGMARLHCLSSRPVLMNFLYMAAEDLAFDLEVASSCSTVTIDDLSHGFAGDLALIQRLHRLRCEYEDLVGVEAEVAS